MAAREASFTADWARAVGVGVGYGIVAYALLLFTRFQAPVESIWFSNALLVWALATSGWRAWPPLIACASLGHVGAHFATGDSSDLTFAFLIGDMAECAFAAALFKRRPEALDFTRRAPTFYFLAVCIIAPLASACVTQASYLALTGQVLGMQEFVVWFGVDALGLVVFLPLIMTTAQGRWRTLKGKLWHTAAAVALILGVVAVSALFNLPLLRLALLPLFVLVAFGLGVAGMQLTLCVMLFAWVALIYSGYSLPVFGQTDMRTNLLLVQTLLFVFACTLLPLAVIVEQRAKLMTALQKTIAETQEAWGAIIGAEARYQLVVSNVSETVMRVAPGGEILFATPACMTMLGATREFEGCNLVEMMHPEDRAFVLERVRQSVEQGLFNLVQRWQVRLISDDGGWYTLDARVTPVALGKGGHEFIVVLRPAVHVISERQLRA